MSCVPAGPDMCQCGLGHQTVRQQQAHLSPSPHSYRPMDSILVWGHPRTPLTLIPPSDPAPYAISCELDIRVFNKRILQGAIQALAEAAIFLGYLLKILPLAFQ